MRKPSGTRASLSFPKHIPERIRDSQAALSLYAETAQAVPDLKAPARRPQRPHVYAPTDPRVQTEADIQHAILTYLRLHPKVAWVGRFNSGAATGTYNGMRTFIRFSSVKGLSDIGGMLKGGRALWIECKRKDGRLTDEQAAFIEAVNAGGGIAFVARSIEDVERELATA